MTATAQLSILDFTDAAPAATAIEAAEAPMNPTTGARYAGGNVMALAIQSAERGFTSNKFAGFQQWLKAGRAVRKGEKGMQIMKVGQYDKANPKTGAVEQKTFAKHSFVFAWEQTEALA